MAVQQNLNTIICAAHNWHSSWTSSKKRVICKLYAEVKHMRNYDLSLLSVHLYRKSYRFVSGIPYGLKTDNSNTVQIYATTPTMLTRIWNLWAYFSCFITGLLYLLLFTRASVNHSTMNLSTMGFMVGAAHIVCVIFTLAVAFVIFKNNHIFYYINQVLQNKLIIPYSISNRLFSKSGTLSITLGVAILKSGIPLPFILWCLRLDPVQVFLVKYACYPIESRILKFVSLALIMQAIYAWMTVMYLNAFTCIQFTAGLNAAYQRLKSMQNRTNEDLFIKFYTNLIVLGNILRNGIRYICLANVFLSQAMLTTFVWMVVYGRGQLPNFFVIGCMVSFIVGSLVVKYILHQSTKCRHYSTVILNKQENLFHKFNRGKISYYYSAKWRAQQPFPLYCGAFFVLDENFVPLFGQVLIENIANAVILIVP